MLGIQQQTHTAAVHHATSRSVVSAAASPPASLRTIPITKIRQSTVQKPSFTDTLSPTQDIQETRAEARTEPSSAWSEAAGNDRNTDEHNAESESDKPGEVTKVANATDKSVEGQPVSNTAEANDSTIEQVQGEEGADGKTDPLDDYTRHPSSPLSELSPAPEEDENPNQEEQGEGERTGESTAAATAGQNGNMPILGHLNPSSDGHSTGGITQNNTVPTAAFGGESNTTDGLPPSTPLRNSSSQLAPTTEAPATFSPGKQFGGNAQAGPSSLTSGSSKAAKESKFSILLDLNAELFRVCQAFVSAGYSPQATPEAQPFAKRLEENLHWMSAHADGRPFAIAGPPEMELPVLAQSAAQIPFPEGVFERISNLYARLHVVFANDIARKTQLFSSPSAAGTPARNSATPSILPPSGIGVKRERPDSAGFQRHESPTAAKRRDTGENKTFMGSSTPMQGSSGSVTDMPPPTTPGFPSPSHSQMARPGSSAGGINPMAVNESQAQGSIDGMFSPSSGAAMGMNNMHGLGNMGNLSPEAQARARQMQMRQAMMMQQQQQQQQQQHQAQMHQQGGQEQQGLQRGSPSGKTAMSSPQRQSSVSLSPTQQQQMLQAQAQAARQMSPPSSSPGVGSGMGINGTDGMGSGQQSPVAGNMPQANMSMNSGGTNVNPNMTLNPQMLANMSSGAIAAYQVLQNPQHPMTRYLNQQMPGFSQLPIMDQMRRFQALQQQRQMQQQSQRNQQMITNQMMGGQMSPTNATASGSGSSQMGQMGHMNVAPQMQSSTSETGFSGTPASANVPGRPATSMGMQQQMGGMSGMQGIPNMANLNPQQRQLYLMQMQMRNAGIGGSNLGGNTGMNPAMANPQLLQERQRLEQQRLALAQRGSPLNPTASAGQFPPGLRSNPTASVGIARTGRSPSVTGDMTGAATPRIGGRMLPGTDDYQRQALLQQAQRNAQMQQQQQQQQQQGFMQGQGQPQAGWQGQQSQQMPLSAGAWPQQNQGFGMGASPSNAGMQGVDFMSPSRQASATPAPSMGHHSPTAPTTDFDNMMNW